MDNNKKKEGMREIIYIYIYMYIYIRGMALVVSADFLHNFPITMFLTKHIIN